MYTHLHVQLSVNCIETVKRGITKAVQVVTETEAVTLVFQLVSVLLRMD